MSTNCDSTMKKGDELSHNKLVEYQDSIKNFGSLTMVDDGDKIGDFSVETEKLARGQEEGPLLSGREKLKRHWTKVGGRVFVPEKWGQEGNLREWMDYSSFDTLLAPKGLNSAREALISQGKRARSGSSSSSRMLGIRSR